MCYAHPTMNCGTCRLDGVVCATLRCAPLLHACNATNSSHSSFQTAPMGSEQSQSGNGASANGAAGANGSRATAGNSRSGPPSHAGSSAAAAHRPFGVHNRPMSATAARLQRGNTIAVSGQSDGGGGGASSSQQSDSRPASPPMSVCSDSDLPYISYTDKPIGGGCCVVFCNQNERLCFSKIKSFFIVSIFARPVFTPRHQIHRSSATRAPAPLRPLPPPIAMPAHATPCTRRPRRPSAGRALPANRDRPRPRSSSCRRHRKRSWTPICSAFR